MLEKLEELGKDFRESVKNVQNKNSLADLKSRYLGKKGKLNAILGDMRLADTATRKQVGAKANELKLEMQTKLDELLQQIELAEVNDQLRKTRLDVTFTDSIKAKGLQAAGYHPVTLIQREVEDIFISMGFDILDGPHIEDAFHNFEALNIPDTHPARDMQDTFWFADMEHLLRTHTSTIQVRGMGIYKPPFKFVGPGKVFRCEATDASHEIAFHQLEGMMVGEDISVANLIYFMKTLLSEIFHQQVEVRLRPGFFPFVEPGFELDIACLICNGRGCKVCKHTGWVELLPCGMVHPNVLMAGGINPSRWNGFAFGLGLDRLVMMRYQIDDIRHLHGGDLRFIEQFKAY